MISVGRIEKAICFIRGEEVMLDRDLAKWIHEEFPKLLCFEWQDGYDGFAVSKSQIPDVIADIQNQRDHHCKRSFQKAYPELLKKPDVDYDERCLWR